jgi:glycosyltransferase involved in cell wall biosynthesis
MKPIGILQVCDSLAAGGMERVAVNLANALPTDRYRSHLCATREEGLLAEFVAPHVSRICLNRAGRFDRAAMHRLVGYIRDNDIQLLHAHGTALFMSVLASLSKPRPAVVWHDHFGRYATEDRPSWLYRLATRRVAGVIAVNQPLVEWSQHRLKVPTNRVWYVPNFVCRPPAEVIVPELPGRVGGRVVCVANLRPEKDHLTLLAAMREVVRAVPAVHLILVGQATDRDYLQRVQSAMLAGSVTWLGPRTDVAAILRGCDIGVLSSASEGLPLALIEYGMAGLPAVATRVGQCAEVLDDGRAGVLVPPSSPSALAKALTDLLGGLGRRKELGQALQARVYQSYSVENVMQQITAIYETVGAA